METTTQIIDTARDVSESMLTRNFWAFLKAISSTELMDVSNPHLNIVKDMGFATIPVKEQMLLDDFVKMLKEVVNVNILYWVKTRDSQVSNVILYSMPYHDEMFVIGIKTQPLEIVNEIQLTFYESLDCMFNDLNAYLAKIETMKYIKVQKQQLAQLYHVFV